MARRRGVAAPKVLTLEELPDWVLRPPVSGLAVPRSAAAAAVRAAEAANAEQYAQLKAWRRRRNAWLVEHDVPYSHAELVDERRRRFAGGAERNA